MRLTPHQYQILKAIADKNPDGSLLDLDQVLTHFPSTSKAAIQFSLRSLIKKMLVVKDVCVYRRKAKRRLLRATVKGSFVAGVSRDAAASEDITEIAKQWSLSAADDILEATKNFEERNTHSERH